MLESVEVMSERVEMDDKKGEFREVWSGSGPDMKPVLSR